MRVMYGSGRWLLPLSLLHKRLYAVELLAI